MNSPVSASPNDTPDHPEPPFEPSRVEELLRQLDKTVRLHQLYKHNNPTYLKALETLRTLFAGVWAHADSLILQVTDTQFTWYGVAVHDQPEKASDSLPWTLFKDGVREITLSAGFEEKEVEGLLNIIPRVRKALDHEDDLITLLWEQEFAHLTYRFVDVSSESGRPIDSSAEPGRWPVSAGATVEEPRHAIDEARGEQTEGAVGGDGAQEDERRPSGIVRMDEFDSTLYFLDADEIAYLRAETEREYSMDVRKEVLNALLDILEQQSEPAVRIEVAKHLDVLTLHLLAARNFSSVAHLLREVVVVLERVSDLPPDVRASLVNLPQRLSEPDALAQLLEALDDAAVSPSQDDLADLFGQLRPAALGPMLAWLAQSHNAGLRPVLEAAADRLAQSNTSELVRLIASPDLTLALEAVRRAGALKTGAAVPALARMMGQPDRHVRVAVVMALVDVGSPTAMQALEVALEDTEREVRVTAVKALAQRAYRPALARVTQLIKSKEIRDVDRTERVGIFELFGAICGDAGVPYLDELLNGRGGLFSRKEHPDIRACAAIALGRTGTQRANDALQKALGEKDVIVRSAVSRALKGGTA